MSAGTSLVVHAALGLHAPNAGDLRSIPSQGIRFHMLQIKILHAILKTQGSQTNNFFFFYKSVCCFSLPLQLAGKWCLVGVGKTGSAQRESWSWISPLGSGRGSGATIRFSYPVQSLVPRVPREEGHCWSVRFLVSATSKKPGKGRSSNPL